MNLDEQIIHRLNELILEELGVSDDVRQMTTELFPQVRDSILKNIKNSSLTNKLGEPYNGFVKETKSSLTTMLFGEKLTIEIRNFNFPNRECFQQCYQQYGEKLFNGGSERRDKRFNATNRYIRQSINLWTFTINGGLLTDLTKNTLQHEISHLFEQFRMDKPYNIDALYSNSMNNLNVSDYLTSCITHVFYFRGQGEITSFANGLYAELVDRVENGEDLTKELLFSTTTYKTYVDLVKRVNYLCNHVNDGRINEILNTLGTNMKQGTLMVVAKRICKRLLYAMGKVWIKVLEDLFGKNFDPRMRYGSDNRYIVR